MEYGILRALGVLWIFDDFEERQVSLVVLSGRQPEHRSNTLK